MKLEIVGTFDDDGRLRLLKPEIKYFSLYIHGFVDFFMLNDKGWHMPETDKKKSVWIKTVIAQNRIDAMVEVIQEGDIFEHITQAYLVDPKRVAIDKYKKSLEKEVA